MSDNRPADHISRKPAVLTLPGMDRVIVRKDVAYQLVNDGPLMLELYYPPDTLPGSRLPAVVFVAGAGDPGLQKSMGCRFKEMASTISWARLVAASGMIGVSYSNLVAEDAHIAVKHLRHYSASLGVDPERVGVWASSGNVPMALAVLMKARELRCGALMYGYMLDAKGSTLITDTLKVWGFANPAANTSVSDLRADLPIFVARAGREHFPHLNSALDRFVSDAIARNMPITAVNHATGRHAFDLLDDDEVTRQVIQQTLAFLGASLAA